MTAIIAGKGLSCLFISNGPRVNYKVEGCTHPGRFNQSTAKEQKQTKA